MAGFGQVRSDVFDRVSRSQFYRDNLAGLTAHQRHQRLLAELNRGGELQPEDAAAVLASTVTDEDVLRQHHRFLRTAADDAECDPSDWGARLARRYYERLFKEYAIADLSRYQQSKVGMRWRTKAEVVSGKGQFICGAKGCNETAGLASYEVNFSYVEAGSAKQALVKLRLCDACAAKLNYKREKQYKKLGHALAEGKQQRGRHSTRGEEQQQRKQKRRGRDRDRSTSCEPEEGDDSRHHSTSGSKRRRRRSDDAVAVQQQWQQGLKDEHLTGTAPIKGGDIDAEQHRAAAGVDNADIDKWLDSLFRAA